MTDIGLKVLRYSAGHGDACHDGSTSFRGERRSV